MAYPPQYRREPPQALPTIRVPGADRFSSQDHDTPYGRSIARSIPGGETRVDAPPPLPPPRFLPNDPVRPDQNMAPRKPDHGLTSSAFASGYGSITSSFPEDGPNYKRREHADDEGYASWSSSDRSRDSFPAEFGLHHNRFEFRSPAEVHGNSMKEMLNPLRTTDKPAPISLLSASPNEILSRRPPPDPRSLTRIVPSQLPFHQRNIHDSPGKLSDTPIHSAVSPRSGPFSHSPIGHRSPLEGFDYERSPQGRSRRNNSDAASSTQGSYESNGADEMDVDDSSSIRRLYIDEAYSVSGQKRQRAASPPPPHGSALHYGGETGHRASGSRGSPAPRLTAGSTASMPTISRSSSYISTSSVAGTTNSFGRRSPGGHSPGGLSPISTASPNSTPMVMNVSHQAPTSNSMPSHTRATSGVGPRKLADIQKPTGLHVQEYHLCQCCPKKPKKFETVEELNAHAAEKQFNCLYCGNRFKNKNEAERHQNSLHVRRHSWSCSALHGHDRAFHESSARPGEADTCGYCGEDFARTGRGPGGSTPRYVTDQDRSMRIRHLQDQHKFGECNSSKKFYRADHFRQHLKHSHAGTSGKWTNMLENACMIEEEPPRAV